MWKGFSQPKWKELDPLGWVAITLMMPPTEKPITAVYSMMTRIHWKFVVQRMP